MFHSALLSAARYLFANIDDLSMCLLFAVPRVCDACKETEENDNEIVDNLCKNDFGKLAFTL